MTEEEAAEAEGQSVPIFEKRKLEYKYATDVCALEDLEEKHPTVAAAAKKRAQARCYANPMEATDLMAPILQIRF